MAAVLGARDGRAVGAGAETVAEAATSAVALGSAAVVVVLHPTRRAAVTTNATAHHARSRAVAMLMA